MTIEKLRGWLEVIGIFGVIGSLVFVGVQIRQDQEIARASIYQARSEMLAQTMGAAAANTEAIAVLAKAAVGDPDREIVLEGFKAPLSAREYMQATFQIRSIFALTDNSFHQYQEGFLPKEHWAAVRFTVKRFAAENPLYRREVESSLDAMAPALREEIVNIFEEIDSESRN